MVWKEKEGKEEKGVERMSGKRIWVKGYGILGDEVSMGDKDEMGEVMDENILS